MKIIRYIFLAVITLFYGCKGQKEQVAKAPVSVEVISVMAESEEIGQSYVGVVEEQEATAVSFTGMGVVRKLYVTEGQQVNKGQLIAVIDETQARNLLTAAEAGMKQANDALSRYKMLHDAGSLPEMNWVEIQSKVTQAQAQLDVARKNLDDCRLIAPVDGVIGKRMASVGETAMPSQTVVSILNVNQVKVKVSVPENEMNSIQANTTSSIRVDAIDRTYTGGHIEKGIEADAMTHTYDIRITAANPGHHLLPGMVANVTFAGAETSDGHPQVPSSAVQKNTDGTLFVWTIDERSLAHRTPVTIGGAIGNNLSITSGISQGQCVVTEGYQKLSEGSEVKVRLNR